MGDRTAWWIGAVLAVANLVVGIWDVALGNTRGAAFCLAVCVGLVVACVRGSNLMRRHQ